MTLAAIAAAFGVVACITAPPPDLPAALAHSPTIVHGSVVPSAGQILTEWPVDNAFTVPVEVYEPDQQGAWAVFVDYHPATNGSSPMSESATAGAGTFVASPATLDGGIKLVTFFLTVGDLAQRGQAGDCHTIQFLVASAFNGMRSAHTPDSLGGDSVEWFFQPGAPGSCDEYDAGELQDGAFPSGDAPADALPLTPDSVGPL